MLVFADPDRLREVAPLLSASRAQTEQRVSIVLPVIQFSHARKDSPSERAAGSLPEELAYDLRSHLQTFSTADAVQRLRGGDRADTLAGGILGAKGKLIFTDSKCIRFHGEDCLMAAIKQDPYELSLRFPADAEMQLEHYRDQMATVLGICRWTPPYRPGSGSDIALAIRVIAMFED